MEDTLLEFAACCRSNGMRVSTAEVLDCLAQLALISPFDQATFHTVLKTNFSKSRREQAEFERIFALFFHGLNRGGAGEDPHGGAPQDRDLDRYMALMAEGGNPGQDETDKALEAFMAGDPQMFIAQVHRVHDQETQAVQAVKSNLGQLTLRLSIMLAIGRMRTRVARFLGDLDAQIPQKDLAAQAQARLDQAAAFLAQDPRPDNPGLRKAGAGEKHFQDLGEVPFSNLTPEEMARVQEVVDQWVRKLKDAATLRFAAARKGGVDVRKTIHRSGRYLGVPMEIKRRDRPLRKARIVVLCDVSGSVWSTARFMLSILYALQVCFARVKSFVFIDRPWEVTPYFLAHDASTAVQKILKDPRLNYNARTDYGLTFQLFRENHLRDLDKKTTLIVMGDGRSNYLNPREPVLEALREQCRRLVWLNPEQERFWSTGDSEMTRYQHHCNEARPCGNLNQLIDFIKDLIL